MSNRLTRRLFVEMLREEWRLHATLFGATRFALFPVIVLVVTAGAVALLAAVGIEARLTVMGGFVLTFLFGLHTGTIGFIGRDTFRNVLGDVTFLLFSARTLPISPRRLLAIFVVKDLCYYGALVILPVALGLWPAAVGDRSGGLFQILGMGGWLWITLLATFVLGMGVTMVGVGVAGRGPVRLGAFLAMLGGLGGAWWIGIDPIAYSPYGVYSDPAPVSTIVGALGLGVVLLLGAGSLELATERRTRRADPLYDWLYRLIGDSVAAKSLLDVHRSSGGILKLFVSGAILFAVAALLVEFAGILTGTSPSIGVSFGAILGLSAFTAYNWLTQHDGFAEYSFLPVDIRLVFHGKLFAFVLMGPTVSLSYFAIAVAWWGSPAIDAFVGAVLVVTVAMYIFGITVYLVGLSPNELLFDSVLFASFGGIMIVGVVPVLVVGLAATPITPPEAVGLFGYAVGLALVGYWSYRRAARKWEPLLRRSTS